MTPALDRSHVPSPRRRAILAGAAGLAVGGSGCLQRARSVMNRSGPDPISLSIKTLPTDADPNSILIARFLASQLEAVGIQAQVVPMDREELLRDALLNQRFDAYVARHPETHDPDFLHPLLHSRYGSEPGWQNPFGYANLLVDDLLDAQRRATGRARVDTLRRLQRAVSADCPFAVVAFPDEVRAVRSDRVSGWTGGPLHTPQSYLGLGERVERPRTPIGRGNATATPSEPSDGSALRMTVTDVRATKNLNPLSVEYRDGGAITGLLYDPLARWIGDELVPWAAETWRFLEDADGEGPVVDVVLRDGVEWHDGVVLSPSDVTFTYAFLDDTSLGSMQIPVPAPRFRGRSSLVERATVLDDRTVRLRFRECHPETALLALSVPLFPRHVWEATATDATVANLGDGSVTEAIVRGNMNPVGSGPFRYVSSTVNERLVLSPFEDHFLASADLDGPFSRFAGGFSFDELAFLVVPSTDAAIELLLSGEVDGTASGLSPSVVPRVGHSDVARLHAERSTGFYHVGFNVRSAPLSNARFRRAVARLLDKAYITSEVLSNFGEPAASPLAPYDAVAPTLVWDGRDPELPFPGEDGELDVAAARRPFLEAGYRYDEDSEVLVH